MATTQTAVPNSKREPFNSEQGFGSQIPFDGIHDPGCYVSNWCGHLLRIPEDALKPGRSPVMTIRGLKPLFVTKICHDPYVPVSKARMLAADCDAAVNF